MDDGKPSGPLETKAALVTLPICHLHVHRPLLADSVEKVGLPELPHH
ncbi:hypothetical protein [Pseudomonas sp. G(2018)]|nr:hypothetical protein [Pseudomonas sp. G(2018)]